MRARILALGLAALGGAAVAYAKCVRPRHLYWGASDDEVAMELPGDEFAKECDIDCTHAITVDARPEDVWPWIAQLGQTKAGFYSYNLLENLAGCQMPDVREILPKWQDVQVGDKVWLHPTARPLEVLLVDQGHDLVLSSIWGFHLRPLSEGRRTRLIVRMRGGYDPDLGLLGNLVFWKGLLEPAHWIMERRMMLGIKQLAEATARSARLRSVAHAA